MNPPALVTPKVPAAVDGIAVVLVVVEVGAVAHALACVRIEVGRGRTPLLADGNAPTSVRINPGVGEGERGREGGRREGGREGGRWVGLG